ncbi:MAG: methylenetetrahydrofolate reductase [Acidobacteria bacterium]|nr:methylenetetrahydrofolate reductase [Acidobacteriota bacterium]MBU1474044.1 methylenetetrahydrofolate reductase [Acidobacteriota bacterium]
MTLKDKIEAGRFLFTAELGPPKSAGGDTVRKKCRHFKNIVDGVNITDNQTAIVRLSSIASAVICREEGLEPIVQMTCRDRNRLALQSDLLGMGALELPNVLCLTGDHQRFGNFREAKNVFDLDSIQLIRTAKYLTEGLFLSGETMKNAPKLCIGGAANPFADPLEMRIIRLAKKIEAGADFIQTQPVYDIDRFIAWMDAVRKAGLHQKIAILAGVMPVKSVNALLHMDKEVPGMRIPTGLITRMQQAREPEEEGVQIAVETIQALKHIEGVRGIHLMPLLWESITPRIAEESGLFRKNGEAAPRQNAT